MTLDGTAPETIDQPAGPADLVTESSSQAQFVISPDRPTGPLVAETTLVRESASFRDTYDGHAARFRELGKKQFEGGLSSEELSEKQRLEEMASFGLFEQGLSEDQLEAKDAALQANFEVQGDPQQLAEEYRTLGRKLFDQGLEAEELARYNFLGALAKQGKFEQQKAA